MNLLDKRPLSTILAIMLGGLVFYAYADKGSVARAVLLLCCACFVIAFAVFKIFFKKRRLILIVSACALLITTVFSHIYFDLWFKPYERFEDRRTGPLHPKHGDCGRPGYSLRGIPAGMSASVRLLS